MSVARSPTGSWWQGGYVRGPSWSSPDKVSVDASTELVAAVSSPRLVRLKMLAGAANGVHVNFGAAATVNKFPLEPGESVEFWTAAQVTAIKATGGAAVDVYIALGGEA